MPKRSRSHQLEDISIQRFEQLLPANWVCRRKDKDYGVDLEVELFDERGLATGLIFLVQLKATDDPKKERSVQIKMDRLEYLHGFDSPAMLVRYCSVSNSFHWQWIENVLIGLPESKSPNVNVRFEASDNWRLESPAEIERTLRVYRTLRNRPARLPIGLEVGPCRCSNAEKFEFLHAVNHLRDTSKLIVDCSDPEKCLPILVWLEDGALCAKLDVIASLRFILRRIERSEIFAQLCYVLAFMSARAGLESQVYDLGDLIRDQKAQCQSREAAGFISASLVHKPVLATDIAILNKLDCEQDAAYAGFISRLLGKDVPLDEKKDSVKRFYQSAIAAHDEQSSQSRAAIHYSLGNFLGNIDDPRGAIRSYNLARRLNPEYLDRPYFLFELASNLFQMRRFSCASIAYEASLTREQSAHTALCCGDALLFSGQFERAIGFFKNASASDDFFISSEASVKQQLAEWVKGFCERNSEFPMSAIGAPHAWVDVANHFIERKVSGSALPAALMVAYLCEHNTEAWTRSVQLALQEDEGAWLLPIMGGAIWRCGFGAYTRLRDEFVQLQLPEEIIAGFDTLAEELHAGRPRPSSGKLTMRVGGTSYFDLSVKFDGPSADS